MYSVNRHIASPPGKVFPPGPVQPLGGPVSIRAKRKIYQQSFTSCSQLNMFATVIKPGLDC
jgi:hypothetical protein